MKKLVGGLKNYIIFTIIIFFYKTLLASQIYDYQTDKFIEKINSEILSVNTYSKKINFKILNDNFPNAFITANSTLYLSSGLIIHSPDYISFLGVLAHEIGHLEMYHITKRKNEIDDLKNINSLGNLVAIAGSMIIQNPELINAIIVNTTTINNLFINFSQDQEREADLYAVETLDKLKLPSDSIKEFLLILEDKTKFDIVDSELKKFSTHPLFEERYQIMDLKIKNNYNKLDQNIENEFNFIKAKFLAYTKNNNTNKLKGDQKVYYEAIKDSLSGNLFSSLVKLNSLISKNNNNFYLIETKADILMSYGYNKQALDFYTKVYKHYPDNNYVKFNIFINSKVNLTNMKLIENTFKENQNLIYIFPNNQNLINKFYHLSKILKYPDWIEFFDIIMLKKNNIKDHLIDLESETKDNNLKKIIKLYI